MLTQQCGLQAFQRSVTLGGGCHMTSRVRLPHQRYWVTSRSHDPCR